jgi:hypothetical protein
MSTSAVPNTSGRPVRQGAPSSRNAICRKGAQAGNFKKERKWKPSIHMPFFRHVPGIKSVQAEAPFGQKYFKKWWDKACNNLGVEGLDLYGGTRHTTTIALARAVGKDGARKASEHKTNKAFDRYCQIQDDSAFEMAKITAELKGKGAEVIKLQKKKSK